MHAAPRVLAPLLRDYETAAKDALFSQNTYPCPICLMTLKGTKCIQLSCCHTFCRSCLGDFWQLCIIEGDVGRVRCPDPECMKVNEEANAEEVARVVTEAEVQRWRWLREMKNIDKGEFWMTRCDDAPNTACQILRSSTVRWLSARLPSVSLTIQKKVPVGND